MTGYRVWAIDHGLLGGMLPPLRELNRPLVEPYLEVIEKLREARVELTAITSFGKGDCDLAAGLALHVEGSAFLTVVG
jgi:hypothetical protein